MANLYFTSTGERISEQIIQTRYSKALRQKYQDSPVQICAGCGQRATCSAHIIAKARLKVLHKTELIYNPKAFFPACYGCNQAIENPKGEAWKQLKNIDYCLFFIEMHDPELFSKFILK